jgi:hypothetical protein
MPTAVDVSAPKAIPAGIAGKKCGIIDRRKRTWPGDSSPFSSCPFRFRWAEFPRAPPKKALRLSLST